MTIKSISVVFKRKNEDASPRHGGSWKIAYADFVTAMMAFFLLMWLLNSSSDEVKKGVADYFSGTFIDLKASGTGRSIFGGTKMEEDKVSNKRKKETSDSRINNVTVNDANSNKENISYASSSDYILNKESSSKYRKTIPSKLELAKEQANEIRNALKEDLSIKDLLPQVLFNPTNDGLKINLIDSDKNSMFPIGSSVPLPRTLKILKIIAEIVKTSDDFITIEGHTDSRQYINAKHYGNWELSADRANSTRRYLISYGINGSMIKSVTGKEATDPLLPKDPKNAINRRVAINISK